VIRNSSAFAQALRRDKPIQGFDDQGFDDQRFDD
jgi:hypothetical protein